MSDFFILIELMMKNNENKQFKLTKYRCDNITKERSSNEISYSPISVQAEQNTNLSS